MIEREALAVSRKPVICVAENRTWCEPGIRLLIASLARHSPDLTIELFYPVAPASFVEWVANYPRVRLNSLTLPEPWRGWNIKPEALLALLNGGYDDVLWVDTDIIVAKDINLIYRGLSMDTLVVAEEALCSSHYDGDAMRARLWGLEIGRALPFQLNGGVVGFTKRHIEFLEDWRKVLNSDEYLEAQKLPWDKRPRHFMADQEVLTAMLCGKQYASLPLHFLYRGKSIIQYFQANCYTLRERFYNLTRGMPFFIHSQGHKVWTPLPEVSGFKAKSLNLYQRMSPYIFEARNYRDVLEDTRWLEPQSAMDRALTAMSLGKAPLGGLPIAILNDAFRHIKWAHKGGEPRR